VLFWEGVVSHGLGHGRLDQLGRLAEPHAGEPSNDLAGAVETGVHLALLEHREQGRRAAAHGCELYGNRADGPVLRRLAIPPPRALD
jgi:hypothetical protein